MSDYSQRTLTHPSSGVSAEGIQFSIQGSLGKILKPFASLRLTVILLAMSMIVIFAGTWAQIDHDVWTVQKRYFHSFFTWIHFQLFLPRETIPDGTFGKSIVEFLRPLGFPMLGGYSLIGLLLLNLLAAHTLRFKFTSRRLGIILIHGGLILLIVGEIIASIWQVEGHMVIEEGQTVSFTQDVRSVELAVIDPSPSEHDNVTVIPASRLAQQDTISYPTLPFQIRVDRWFHNSILLNEDRARQFDIPHNPQATAGFGVDYTVVEQPRVTGTGPDAGRIDAPSAYITLSDGSRNLGRYLVSMHLRPQDIVVDGRPWRLDLRHMRTYKPYSLTLKEFRFDRYTGTNVPKNFSSRVQLVDPAKNEDREVLIWMNHPLRYAGETFFQADWNKATERGTVLQVVRNPGWLLPYLSCVVVGLGMIVHFGAHLLKFLGRALREEAPVIQATSRKGKPLPRPQQYILKPRPGVLVPGLITALCLLYLMSAGRPPKDTTAFNLNGLRHVPISYEGRVMPMDTLARVSLRVISGKSELRTDAGKLPAIQWIAEVLANKDAAREYKVFRIDYPDLKSIFGLDANEKYFSLEQLVAGLTIFDQQLSMARAVKKDHNPYQKSVLELGKHLELFERLVGAGTLYFAPPTTPGEEWQPLWQAAQDAQATGAVNPGLRAFSSIRQTYHFDQPEPFNATVGDYLGWFRSTLPDVWRKVRFEVLFNQFDPFVKAIYLYVLVFLLICAAWLITPARATLMRSAYWVLILTLIFHTLGLIGRIYIQGRPPVTNLYSSAIFIGWAAVVFCAAIERLYRNGIGTLAATVIAFPSLIIAHYLSSSGDTMQMLQAVLDTNIWLATHVVVITLGYAAVFLAGKIALVYVLGGIFTKAFDDESRKTLARMTYGVLCFAMLFSFVGTVLGGIWADQSWGRFWGWDPKENGAALIVLWIAIVLHARWGGIVRERGFMLLAIFGNVITAWSWFGTNMLGVGLHSYGFMESAVFWIGLYMASQLFVIGLGNLPQQHWRSIQATA